MEPSVSPAKKETNAFTGLVGGDHLSRMHKVWEAGREDDMESTRKAPLFKSRGFEPSDAAVKRTELDKMPERRYLGGFGVGGWATRSGANVLKHGEVVKIERQKIKPSTKGKGRDDIIVRFTNSRGEEVGRLPKETAAWVSTLIDQKLCTFRGTCVYAPDRIRINDTIYLQLRCFALRSAFQSSRFKSTDNNRSAGLYEEKETDEEKDLRIRQVALVKLFEEIHLIPTRTSETTEKTKRQSLLKSAEMAEQNEKLRPSKKAVGTPSSPPSSEEAEDGKELEQDQLDTLYKKAQSFDFNTPSAEPANTFTMDLRRYQKQALHWMMGKENDEKSDKQASMHPLWEEYAWPTHDVDDKEVDKIIDQDYFYVNSYSGEISLDFPLQEQNCLGGVLADGMSTLHHDELG
jgi:DNA repair protein RAD5